MNVLITEYYFLNPLLFVNYPVKDRVGVAEKERRNVSDEILYSESIVSIY